MFVEGKKNRRSRRVNVDNYVKNGAGLTSVKVFFFTIVLNEQCGERATSFLLQV